MLNPLSALIAISTAFQPIDIQAQRPDAYFCHQEHLKCAVGFRILEAESAKAEVLCEFWLLTDRGEWALIESVQRMGEMHRCSTELKSTIDSCKEQGWQCTSSELPIPIESQIKSRWAVR